MKRGNCFQYSVDMGKKKTTQQPSSERVYSDSVVKANYISYTGIARLNCAQPNIQK